MKIRAYLNFDGNAEEALRFYQKVLRGELTEIQRFDSLPEGAGPPLTEEQKNLVLHVGLDLPNGEMIMASDVVEGMGPPLVAGTNVNLMINPDSREEAERVFEELAEGGTITMPLEMQFWGDLFGGLTDRFGIHWMVNYGEAPSQ
ncbi:MAG: VOC family protein [Myxococcota bacterium]